MTHRGRIPAIWSRYAGKTADVHSRIPVDWDVASELRQAEAWAFGRIARVRARLPRSRRLQAPNP